MVLAAPKSDGRPLAYAHLLSAGADTTKAFKEKMFANLMIIPNPTDIIFSDKRFLKAKLFNYFNK